MFKPLLSDFQKNAMGEEELPLLKEFKTFLQSTLVAFGSDGASFSLVNQRFSEDWVGSPSLKEYAVKLGFKSVMKLLESIPDQVTILLSPAGEITLKPVPMEETRDNLATIDETNKELKSERMRRHQYEPLSASVIAQLASGVEAEVEKRGMRERLAKLEADVKADKQGMIQNESEDFRVVVCPDNVRSADVLLPIIQKHVAIGTEIHTDCWRAYARLNEHGYIHKIVNHSDPEHRFIAQDGTHTQRIEAHWRPAKDWFRERRVPGFRFADTLVEYQWRREVKKNGLDPFEQLLSAVKRYYTKN